MDAVQFDAFWSYTHDDDTRARGRVSDLASMLKDEFAVTTGDELEMFIDRTAIEWGDLWRDRIEGAVGDVPFFIAIVTPKYIRSLECRKEFVGFSSAAKSRSMDSMLLPILYIDVPDLREDSSDEVLALIARTQFVDWRSLRLKSPDDPEVLQAINKLAVRLQTLREQTKVAVLEIESLSPEQQTDTLNEVLENISVRLEPWTDSVEFDAVAGKQWRAVMKERIDRINRLQKTRGQRGAVLSVFTRLGNELLPLALGRLEKAQTYARTTIELDPFVASAVRLVGAHPHFSHLLDPLRDGIAEAMRNIEPEQSGNWSYAMPNGITDYSKHLAEADAAIMASSDHVQEANDLVVGWRDKLHILDQGINMLKKTPSDDRHNQDF